jgi:hypothetical protein
MNDKISAREDASLSDEFIPISPPKSESVVEDQDSYSTDDKSAFATLSSSRITLIKVSSISRSRPEKADASTAFMEEEILSRKELKLLAMETDVSPREEETDLPKIFSQRIVATTTTSVTQMKKTIVRSLRQPEPKTFKCRATKMCAIMPKKVTSLILYLLILILYAGIHILMATTARNTSLHQFFLYSQLCGFFVFLIWEITGKILI